MSSGKQIIILAGGNGAGKTSFYNSRLKHLHIPFVNADLIARSLSDEISYEVSKRAQNIAQANIQEYFDQGISFCFETVFSHESKIELIKESRSKGYSVELIYLHLESTDLNQARVYQRVLESGHDVPSIKIKERVPRTLINVIEAVKWVDGFTLLDNSSAADPFQKIARVKNGKILFKSGSLPQWAVEILKSFESSLS